MEEHLEESELSDNEEFRAAAGNLMDTKTSHLDDLLNDKLEKAFQEPSSTEMHLHELAKIASEHSPIDLAYAACRLPHALRPTLYKSLPEQEMRISFMISTDKTTRTVVFRELEDEQIASILVETPPDEGVWMLENISERRLHRILDRLPPEKCRHLLDLQKHSRNSAGRLMSNEFFSFTIELTIGEAAAQIRNNPGIDLTRRIFITNDEGELLGFVPARNLIINPPHLPLRQVMRAISHKISPEATRDEVVDLVERYKIPALPVVDQNDYLLGVITYEDVVEAIEELTDAAFGKMAGTSEDVAENLPNSKRFFSRAPWLFVTLCAGLASVTVISYAEHVQGTWFIPLLFVVPLVTAMSGNVGIQCSTILVRSMATGALSSGSRGEAVRKEMTLGLITGLAFGIIAAFVVYIFNILGVDGGGPGAITVSFIVGIGILGACLTATFLGVFSPLFFARIGIDPAIASGPIVTALNDVFSTIMYILIAYWICSIFY